jgi:hypothetical protein
MTLVLGTDRDRSGRLPMDPRSDAS